MNPKIAELLDRIHQIETRHQRKSPRKRGAAQQPFGCSCPLRA